MQSGLNVQEILSRGNLPGHVAVIMDGNGRWASKRRRPRIFGHRNGAKRVREIVEVAGELGLQALTLYAFSEENWRRPPDEVSALFRLLASYLKSEIKELDRQGVRLRGIGDRSGLPNECQVLLENGENLTETNSGLRLTLALNYGGRSEIVKCCREIARLVTEKKLRFEDIDHQLVASKLSTADLPDPDLLIRTSGEQRVSNFLLWEMAYTEFYFTSLNWPDFTRHDFLEAIGSFQSRVRTFGKLKNDDPRLAYKSGSEEIGC